MRLRLGGLEVHGRGCLAALLLCGCTGAPEPPSGATPDELLRHVSESLADGYFESAWRGLRAFHNHPQRNELPGPVAFAYFLATPRVGTLAALLDKRAAEAGDYATFCPASVTTPHTCGEHAAPEAVWFDDAPVASDVVAQTLPLAPLWLDDVSPWPLATVAVGLPEKDFAVVDTGCTANNLAQATWAASPNIATRIGDATAELQAGVIEAPLMRLHGLRLGGSTFRRIAAHLGIAHMNIVGMTVLLRHDAVCFDWAREELVLGNLGRCAGGHVLDDGVALNDGLGLQVDLLPQPPGLSPVDRLAMIGDLDTGTHQTLCSKKVLDLLGGPRFSFGEHPDLIGTCVYDENRDVPGGRRPGKHRSSETSADRHGHASPVRRLRLAAASVAPLLPAAEGRPESPAERACSGELNPWHGTWRQRARGITALPTANPLRARLLVSPSAMGFVAIGQEVRVRLDAFPQTEHGAQIGEVSAISGTASPAVDTRVGALAGGAVFRVRVRFPNGFDLPSEQRRALRPGMTVTADLIRERGTLLDWLIEPLRGAAARV